MTIEQNVVGRSEEASRGRMSHYAISIFLVALFVDYGGGLGIKATVGALSLCYAAIQPRYLASLGYVRRELIVLCGLPLVLDLLHMIAGSQVPIWEQLTDAYTHLSSPLLLLLFPLIIRIKVERIVRILRILYIMVAFIMIGVTVLHFLGLIDINHLAEFTNQYRISRYVGRDSRDLTGSDATAIMVGFSISYTLTFAAGLSLSEPLAMQYLFFFALLLLRARGMLLGAIFGVVLWIGLKKFLPRPRLRRRRSSVRVGAAIIALAIVAYVTLFSRFSELTYGSISTLSSRVQELVGARDKSTSIRVNSFESLGRMYKEKPIGIFFGYGPSTPFLDYGDSDQKVTEISFVVLAKNYGVLYTALFFVILLWAANDLWKLRRRPGFGKRDLALITASVSFWLAANTNPVLLGPISLIALMLLRARYFELRNDMSPNIATSKRDNRRKNGPRAL